MRSSLPVDMPDRESFLSAESLLLNCQAELALEAIAALPITNDVQGRIRWHFAGQAYIHLGQLDRARAALVKAIESFGENVSLLRDLTAVHYQLGDLNSWRKSLNHFERSFQQQEDKLSGTSLIQNAVMLAKFKEETGEIAVAMKIYERALEAAHADPLLHLRHLVLPNLVRLKASYNSHEGLGALYAELISLKLALHNFDLTVEIQHALVIAELCLIGRDHAWGRVVSLAGDQRLGLADRRLIFYDFIEECLFQKIEPSPQAELIRQQMGQLDLFEEQIERLAFGDQEDLQLLGESDLRLSGELSFSCYLRILMLRLGRLETSPLAQEIKNKVLLLVSGLDAESRSLWLGRLQPLLAIQDLQMRYEAHARRLVYQSKSLDLSKKKGMAALIALLSETPERSVEEVIQALWETEFSLEHFHRLRMTVHRLNLLLFELTAVQKIIEINSERISIRPGVPLKLAVS